MSIELFLFVVVGALAVAAAAAMLVTDNAVYSALFLILNFACVAFLYLMLDAPFLAMVQIAVYAGAIMVLFLFVIMLLDAEVDPEGDNRSFKWLAPTALGLALALVIASSLAFFAGEIDEQPVPEDAPLLRVVNLAPRFLDEGDVYLDETLLAANLPFDEVSDYVTLEPGTYSVSIGGDDPRLAQPIPLDSITLEAGDVQTLVLYGASIVIGGDDVQELGLPQLLLVQDDLTPTAADEGRVTVVNAYTGEEAVDLVDAGSDLAITDGEDVEMVLGGIAANTALEPALFREGRQDWVFTAAGDDRIITRLRDFTVEGDVSHLLILAEGRPGPGGERTPFTRIVAQDDLPAFGSPEAIGQSLFIDYVLPFQLVAMLLLAAMVGVIVLTQRAGIKPKPGRPTRRKVSRPLTSVISTQTGHDVMTPDRPKLDAPQEPGADSQPEPAGD